VKSDAVIIAANGISVAMVGVILFFKLRGGKEHRSLAAVVPPKENRQ